MVRGMSVYQTPHRPPSTSHAVFVDQPAGRAIAAVGDPSWVGFAQPAGNVKENRQSHFELPSGSSANELHRESFLYRFCSPRCKPTCFGLHLDAAERLTIARRGCSHCANGIAGKFLNAERLGSYFLERVLELPSRGDIDPIVEGNSKLRC